MSSEPCVRIRSPYIIGKPTSCCTIEGFRVGPGSDWVISPTGADGSSARVVVQGPEGIAQRRAGGAPLTMIGGQPRPGALRAPLTDSKETPHPTACLGVCCPV